MSEDELELDLDEFEGKSQNGETLTIPFCAECKEIPCHALKYEDEELMYCPLCFHCCKKGAEE